MLDIVIAARHESTYLLDQTDAAMVTTGMTIVTLQRHPAFVLQTLRSLSKRQIWQDCITAPIFRLNMKRLLNIFQVWQQMGAFIGCETIRRMTSLRLYTVVNFFQMIILDTRLMYWDIPNLLLVQFWHWCQHRKCEGKIVIRPCAESTRDLQSVMISVSNHSAFYSSSFVFTNFGQEIIDWQLVFFYKIHYFRNNFHWCPNKVHASSSNLLLEKVDSATVQYQLMDFFIHAFMKSYSYRQEHNLKWEKEGEREREWVRREAEVNVEVKDHQE